MIENAESKAKIRVRKLTPKECWRLMGFTDDDFHKAQMAMNQNLYGGNDRSGSQLYKQAGNSIVVDVLCAILRELYGAMPYLFEDKLDQGIIPQSEKAGFDAAIPEELRVFEKIDMSGYMLCMSELIRWCWDNEIPIGPGRGSVGGSRVAYVTDIIDIDPERWGTIFSRFANEYRKEVGD